MSDDAARIRDPKRVERLRDVYRGICFVIDVSGMGNDGLGKLQLAVALIHEACLCSGQSTDAAHVIVKQELDRINAECNAPKAKA